MNRLKLRGKIWIGFGLVVVILLIVVANVKQGSNIKVQVQKVKKGRIERIVSAPGDISSRVEVNINSDIMGKLMKLYIEEGDIVNVGDTLAKLDETDPRANLEIALSKLSSDSASFAQKKLMFERKKKLFEKELISREEYEQAEISYKVAEASLEQSRAQVRSARHRLDKCVLISPIKGVVTKVNVKEGENVITGTMNNPGTVLMTISDLSTIEIVAQVDESEIPLVKVGDSVRISVDAFPDSTFIRVVRNIASKPIYTSGTGAVNYETKIRFVNLSIPLFPGMSGNCDIIVQKKDGVLRIPLQSLVTRKKKKGAFIVNNGKVHFTKIKEGLMGERYVEILEGIKEGDLVVTGPFKALKGLKDGQRVSYRSPEVSSRINKNK